MSVTSAIRASTRAGSDTARWVVIVGVAVIFAGLMLRGVAAILEATAELIGEFSGGPLDQPEIAAATSLGQWGLGMFLFGSALVLVALTAMLTSVPSCSGRQPRT